MKTEIGYSEDFDGLKKSSFLDGKLHKDGAPAIIYIDGTSMYYKHGVQHREDGPAVIYGNLHTEYWLNGVKLTEKDFNTLILKNKLNEDLINKSKIHNDGFKRIKI